jgi:hypothetical protein
MGCDPNRTLGLIAGSAAEPLHVSDLSSMRKVWRTVGKLLLMVQQPDALAARRSDARSSCGRFIEAALISRE